MPNRLTSIRVTPLSSSDSTSGLSSKLNSRMSPKSQLSTTFMQDLDGLGLPMHAIMEFIERSGGRGVFQGLTIHDVWMNFLQTDLNPNQCVSYCTKLKAYSDERVSNPNILVIESWTDIFLEVVDTLEHYCVDGDVSVWFDLFAIGQPVASQLHLLDDALKQCTNAFIIVPNWNSPNFMGKAWCLFALWKAFQVDITIEIAVGWHSLQDVYHNIKALQFDQVMSPYHTCNLQLTDNGDKNELKTHILTCFQKNHSLYEIQTLLLNMIRQKALTFVHYCVSLRNTDNEIHFVSYMEWKTKYFSKSTIANTMNMANTFGKSIKLSDQLTSIQRVDSDTICEDIPAINIVNNNNNMMKDRHLLQQLMLARLYVRIEDYDNPTRIYYDNFIKIYESLTYPLDPFHIKNLIIILLEMASVFELRNSYTIVIQCYERCIELYAECHGLTHEFIKTNLYSLLYHIKSEAYTRKIIQMYIKLAYAFEKMNEHIQTETLLRHGHEYCLVTYGVYDTNTIEILHRLIEFYYKINRMFECDQYRTMLTQIDIHHMSLTIPALRLLANYYDHNGNYEVAIRCLEQIRNDCGMFTSLDHQAIIQLAEIYRKQNKYHHAETLLHDNHTQQIVKTNEKSMPSLYLQYQLGKFYLDTKRFHYANDILLPCLEAQSILHGRAHEHTIQTMCAVGNLYLQDGKLTLAEELLVECIQKAIGLHGITHEVTLRIMTVLADVYCQLKDLQSAKFILVKVVHIRLKLFPLELETLDIQINLGLIYSMLKQYQDAEDLLGHCAKDCQERFGDDDKITVRLSSLLGNCYFKQGRYDLAYPYFEECLRRTKVRFGDDHHDTLTSMHNLSRLLMRIGKYEQASELLDECLRRRIRIYGFDNPIVEGTKATLIELRDIKARNTNLFEKARDLIRKRMKNSKIEVYS